MTMRPAAACHAMRLPRARAAAGPAVRQMAAALLVLAHAACLMMQPAVGQLTTHLASSFEGNYGGFTLNPTPQTTSAFSAVAARTGSRGLVVNISSVLDPLNDWAVQLWVSMTCSARSCGPKRMLHADAWCCMVLHGASWQSPSITSDELPQRAQCQAAVKTTCVTAAVTCMQCVQARRGPACTRAGNNTGAAHCAARGRGRVRHAHATAEPSADRRLLGNHRMRLHGGQSCAFVPPPLACSHSHPGSIRAPPAPVHPPRNRRPWPLTCAWRRCRLRYPSSTHLGFTATACTRAWTRTRHCLP